MKRFPPDDDKILKLLKEGLSQTVSLERLGMSPGGFAKAIARLEKRGLWQGRHRTKARP